MELERFTPVLEAYASDLATTLRAAAPEDAMLARDVAASIDRIEGDPTAAGLGAAVSDLLARLRDDSDPAAEPTAHAVRRLTRRLADDEVGLLASGLERR